MAIQTAVHGIHTEHMDRSVRPCDDFFQYANGTWLRDTEIPPHEVGWGGGAELHDRNQDVLHAILRDAAAQADSSDREIVRKVGRFFASGMDQAAIEAAGVTPVAAELARIDALADHDELPELLAELHRTRVRAGFAFFVDNDAKDSAANLAQLQQGGLGLPDRDYYLRTDERSDTLRRQYREHIAHMLVLLDTAAEAAAAQAEQIYTLEHRLAEASMSRVDQRDPYRLYNKMPVADLARRAPGFAWGRYLDALGAGAATEINMRQPDFFAALAALVSAIPLEGWRAYLRWHLIRQVAPHLSTPFVDAVFAFYGRILTGVTELKPRWKRVLETTDANLGEALGELYVERVFPPEAKAKVLVLVANLRAALSERINGLEWMGPETKAQAQAKLAAFTVKIGYPDPWRDYSGLEVDRGPYATNVMRGIRFEVQRTLRRIGRPVDRGEWYMTPPRVDAYYSPPNNEIVFPAGILQPPFFDPEADDAVNYGAIGGVIGHEMTHGFDDQGSQYDAQGNLRDWWTPADKDAYRSRTDLVVRQFEAYEPLPGLPINGKLCLGENIADLGGIKIAYAAYMRSLDGTPLPPERDGFTPFQRFFLGSAQAWRSKLRDEAMRVRLTIDPHSPGHYRCIGPLSNLPEFFAAFGCEGGAMVRPESERPTIW